MRRRSICAGVRDAAGIVAGTDDDVINLVDRRHGARDQRAASLPSCGRTCGPTMRCSMPIDADMTMVSSEIIANGCLALLQTPLLGRFLEAVQARGRRLGGSGDRTPARRPSEWRHRTSGGLRSTPPMRRHVTKPWGVPTIRSPSGTCAATRPIGERTLPCAPLLLVAGDRHADPAGSGSCRCSGATKSSLRTTRSPTRAADAAAKRQRARLRSAWHRLAWRVDLAEIHAT